MHQRRESGRSIPQGRRPKSLDDGGQVRIPGGELHDGKLERSLGQRGRDDRHSPRTIAQTRAGGGAPNESRGVGVILGMNGELSEGMGVLEPVAGIGEQDSEEGFRRLSARQVQAAYRLAFAIPGDDMEAEDAAQDAFTSAWRQRASLRDPDRFDAWFGRILVNVCRDRLRRRARIRRLPTAREETSPADTAQATLDRDVLGRALAALQPDFRLVVVLRFWADLSVDGIAERLGIPAGTVKSRLNSSMRQLRAALEELA